MDVIDWGAAQRVGELIAGSPPFGGVRAASVEPLAREFAGRVSAYSGLELRRRAAGARAGRPPGLDRGEPEDHAPDAGAAHRAAWTIGKGPFAGPLRSASGLLLGAQVGALTGMLSQRVLGQYDLALLDSSVPPRLLLLAPNLAQAARNLGVDRDELVLWVSIHEITHAVQFSGAPWLRDYLGGMLKELIDGLQVTISGRTVEDDDERRGRRNGRRGGWVPSLPKLGGRARTWRSCARWSSAPAAASCCA